MAERTTEDIFKALTKKIGNQGFVPFVGAGASIDRTGMPTWVELLEKMSSELDFYRASAGEPEEHAPALVVSPQHPARVSKQDRQAELQQECSQLRLENQLLQSRVAELRRTASREVQCFDQLLMEHSELQTQNGNLLNCLRGRIEATDTITALLLKQQNAQLKMIERYEGVVEHVHGDNVIVVFEIDDDVVEHKYDRNQFIDGQLPEEGDRFTVFVHVVHGSVETEDEPPVETDDSDEQDDERSRITGPIEF